MNDQQRQLYGLLKEIHHICEKNDIIYYLAGGTLIGAIRHGGFLPWDDDADLYMTRENWNKFVVACESDLPENRVLQAPDLDVTYGNTFPRYVATDSTCIHSHQVLGGAVVGEVIDIFILDPVSDDDGVLERYTYDLMLYSDLVNYAGVFGRRFGVKARDYLKYVFLKRLKGEGYVRDYFESKLSSYLDDEGSRYVMRWGGNPIVFDKSWFSDFKKTRFEESEFLIPSGANEYLVSHYGDEWALIPSHMEQSSHDAAVISGVSGDEALEYYRPKEKRAALARGLTLRKALMLAGANRDLRLQTEMLEAEAKLQAIKLTRAFGESEEVLSESLLSGDFKTLGAFFSEYLNWQTSKRTIGRDDWSGVYRFNNPVLADLDDRVLYLAIYTLLSTERIGKAARLVEVVDQRRRSLSDLEVIRSFIDDFRLAVNCFQCGRYDDALRITSSLMERHPNNVSVLKLEIVVLSKASRGDEARASHLVDLLEKSSKLFPDDGFFGACRAFFLLEADSTDEAALQLLRRSLGGTNNGFILRFAREVYFAGPVDDGSKGSSFVDVASAGENTGMETSEQALLFVLLKELTSICEENGIVYALSPGAIYSFGCQKLLPNTLGDYSICLDAHNYQKLLRVLPNYVSSNRGFEYRGNSPHFTGDEIRYVSCDSLYVNGKKLGVSVCPGLYVSARLLTAEKYSPLLTMLRNGWNSTALYAKRPRTIKRLVQVAIVLPLFAFGRGRLGVFIHDKTVEESAHADLGAVSFGGKNKLKYPVSLFSRTSFLVFRGVRFRVPRDIRQYLAPFFQRGKSFQDGPLSFPAGVFASATVSFSEFNKAKPFAPSFCFRRSLASLLNAYPRSVRRRFTAEFNRIKHAVSVKKEMISLSRNRELILAKFKSGDFASLQGLFQPYLSLMSKYPPLKKIAFDSSLRKVALAVEAWGEASDELARELEVDRILSAYEGVLDEGL